MLPSLKGLLETNVMSMFSAKRQLLGLDIGSSATGAHLLVVGVALLALVLFARAGLLGAARAVVPWLP